MGGAVWHRDILVGRLDDVHPISVTQRRRVLTPGSGVVSSWRALHSRGTVKRGEEARHALG